MSVLELKGEVYDMLAQVNDEDRLYKNKSFISSLVPKHNGDGTYPDGLTGEQHEALLTSLAKSKDKANQVSLEDARQMFEQWKKR
jgi:hypothetical protein